jgi:protoporphyrinogen IX oxidase
MRCTAYEGMLLAGRLSPYVFPAGQIRMHKPRLRYSKLAHMLWVKAFHIIFVASWFAGLFYLPRIFVNLAQVPPGSEAEKQRLLLMGRKLFKFMTLLAVPAIGLGLWLWMGYGVGRGQGWMHAKLVVVVVALGYHHGCGVILKKFERSANTRSHVWYRWFNEASVLIMVVAVILVVVKPF